MTRAAPTASQIHDLGWVGEPSDVLYQASTEQAVGSLSGPRRGQRPRWLLRIPLQASARRGNLEPPSRQRGTRTACLPPQSMRSSSPTIAANGAVARFRFANTSSSAMGGTSRKPVPRASQPAAQLATGARQA
jgi:hypothetical protein